VAHHEVLGDLLHVLEVEEGVEAQLVIEAHVMVGEDGRAVPFGGAPDHDVQQAVRCLNVMFLEGR